MRDYKLSILSLMFFCSPITLFGQVQNGWTIMYYAAGSNSSEIDMLPDMKEMMDGKTSSGYEIITLVDRIEGHSNDSITLGSNFVDTRLYRFDRGSYDQLDGLEILPEFKQNNSYEANMGDAILLKRFIQYCKKYYPANHYMLVLRSHGNGVSMCADIESGNVDKLYPGELSDILTENESVDILGLDVCSMAGLENFYEWRPGKKKFSVDYILASAPLSAAWNYEEIFKRIQKNGVGNNEDQTNYFDGGNERYLNPLTMTPFEFSKLIFEEIYDSQRWASWGLFDNSKITEIKIKIDELAVLLIEEDKNNIYKMIEKTLGYYHKTNNDLELAKLAFPYIDAYGFASNIEKHPELKFTTKKKAKEVMESIDSMVIHSYYGEGFLPINKNFNEGRYGAYIICPEGKNTFSQTGRTFWQHTDWFTPNDKRNTENSYGLYDWCSDGATAGNNKVENFYEYLDFLFDAVNNLTSGNKYKW